MEPDLPNWLRLKVVPDEYMHWRTFVVPVVGVTRRNPDRSSRQEIIMCCGEGERVGLVRELDNKHDRFAIAVVNKDGEQLGWLPGGDFFLATHIDQGGKTSARVLKLTGGEPDLYGKRTYGCLIEISKWVPDRGKLSSLWDEDRAISDLILDAKALEPTTPRSAIDKYLEAIKRIRRLDQDPLLCQFRSVKYPINRLSLVLERERRFKDCYKVITWWLDLEDRIGLTKGDADSVSRRLQRIKRSLTVKQQLDSEIEALCHADERTGARS